MPAKRAAAKPTDIMKGGETGNMLFARLVPDAEERAKMLFVVDDLDHPVLAFVLVATTVRGQYEPGTPTTGERCLLHWKLCAVTRYSPQYEIQPLDATCLTMEMRSEQGSAYPIFRYYPRINTSKPAVLLVLPLDPSHDVPSFTVRMLLEYLIDELKIHRFRLNDNQSGCLHWSMKIVEKLACRGILAKDVLNLCTEKVKEVRKANKKWVPVAQGVFENPDLQ